MCHARRELRSWTSTKAIAGFVFAFLVACRSDLDADKRSREGSIFDPPLFSASSLALSSEDREDAELWLQVTPEFAGYTLGQGYYRGSSGWFSKKSNPIAESYHEGETQHSSKSYSGEFETED